MSDLDSELKVMKAVDIFSITNDILNQGGQAWITVTGMSMYPFLTEGRDSVELSKTSFAEIKKGDIVLIRRLTGAYVLHRVLKIQRTKDCFYMIGDAQQWIEGPLAPEQLQAVVTSIKRKGRVIRCDSKLLKFCVSIWLLLIPVRSKTLKCARLAKRIAKKINPKFNVGF